MLREMDNKNYFRIDEENSRIYVRRLDYTVCREFKSSIDSLIEKGKTSIDIDLSELKEPTASGIGFIIKHYKELKEKGVDLTMSYPNLLTWELIKITDINRAVPTKYDPKKHSEELEKLNC